MALDLRLWCLFSDDSPEWSAALPMPFELVEDVGFFLQQKNPERVRLSLSSVAFAAEGARLLLLTKEGDLIAVGDGCVQQQLLSVHLTKQKLLQQQQDSWNTAAATIAPRFWADKSRQQRLRGACRIHVPHRRIVEVIGSNWAYQSSSRSCLCCCNAKLQGQHFLSFATC